MAFLITFIEYSFQNLTTGGSTCAILYVTYVRGYPTHFTIHTIPYHTSKIPYFGKLSLNFGFLIWLETQKTEHYASIYNMPESHAAVARSPAST